MQPTVGRVVHYRSYGTPGGEYASECRAAIVTEVPDLLSEQPNSGPDGYIKAVNMAVLNPKGLFFDTDVAYDPDLAGGTWHWPEREESEPRFRDAKTGHYVDEGYAETHPDTTVKES